MMCCCIAAYIPTNHLSLIASMMCCCIAAYIPTNHLSLIASMMCGCIIPTLTMHIPTNHLTKIKKCKTPFIRRGYIQQAVKLLLSATQNTAKGQYRVQDQ
jgi:hypothetical protein